MNAPLHPRSWSPSPGYLPPQPGNIGQTSGPDAAGRPEWTAGDCLRALWRRKATFMYIVGASLLVAGLISLAQPCWYRSDASLEIQEVNENFLNARDIYPTMTSSAYSNGAYVQTQAEMLRQNVLMEQVVNQLHLEARPEFRGGSSIWGSLRPRSGSGSVASMDVQSAAEILKKRVKIVPSRDSRIIQIVCDARQPQLAALIANTLARTFIDRSIEEKRRVAQETHAALSLELGSLRDKLVRSEAQLAADGRDLAAAPGAHRSVYNTLKREVEADRRFYETMAQRVNDAQVASAVRESNIRLVGPARPATHPYKPNLPLNLAIGMFGGLILATSWVMLREQTNSQLRTAGEAGMYLTIPELGAIPQVPNLDLARRGNGVVPGTGQAAMEQQFSDFSEPFRATLASILSAGRNGDHPQVFVVTSAHPMEGRTTVVSNLGIGLAEIGHKVLLIDGDMRRPRLNKMFDLANSWGLSDVLSEKNAIEDLPLDALVKKTAVPRVYVLPSGVGVDNIFGLLCSGRLERLLPRFRDEFDYVLLDAPPCLEFADVRIMARYADQLLLVVRANFTDRRTAQAAVQRLLLDEIPVMGVILNRCDPA